VPGLTYDTAVLIGAARNDHRVWELHRLALARGHSPTVPAVVIVEAWRGEPRMAQFLRGCEVEALDGASARAAGRLLGACAIPVEAADATVVEGALRRGDVVVTSNRKHLAALASAAQRRLSILDV
jgi:hypothetical protein